jgi:flagellar P-ring protein precursor FlgI
MPSLPSIRFYQATCAALFALVLSAVSAQATSRIKDLANIEGVRQNQLIGYGLVVGLNGTTSPSPSSRCRRCWNAWA